MRPRFPRPGNKFAPQQPSAASAKAALAGLIASQDDTAALDKLDPVALARMYRSNPKDVEYLICVARRGLVNA